MVYEVKNEKDFDGQLQTAGKGLVVVHFWAPWAEQCKQMNEVLDELEKLHPNVTYLSLKAEEIPEISQKYEIQAVPTFLFMKNKQKIDRLNGAHAPELTKLVKQHIETIAPPSARDVDPEVTLNNRLKLLTNSADCMVFMKGSPDQPRCGFSRQLVAILNEQNCEYSTFDILGDQDVRQGLKEFSNWPTFPQLYIKGELLGGLDIIKEMLQDGELDSVLPKTSKQESVTLEDRIKAILNQSRVVVFIKGQPSAPRCGFSKQVVAILNNTGVPYTHFDVLSDEEIRQGLKKFSDWPTYPQLYANGELLGGLDVIKEMVENNELNEALSGGN